MNAGRSMRERLRAAIEPVVTAAGYDLEDVTVTPAGRRSIVRVVVDHDDGVSLDGVADLSRAVSAELDSDDGLTGQTPYTLELSSPGVDRPLTEPRHWRRARGRLVLVAVGSAGEDGGAPGARQVEGRVSAADETGIELDVAGERRAVAYADLGPGRVQVEFSRPSADSADVADVDEPAERP